MTTAHKDLTDIGITSEQVGAIRAPLERAALLPATAYASPDVYKAELSRIFGKTWMPVCHVSQLPDPGSFVAKDLAGEPVSAVRGRDGEIRVIANVCLHRNMTLLQGAGNCKGNKMTCPYHGWAYSLEGKLLAAPFMEQAECFTRADMQLRTFRSEIWQGFVFVNFDDHAQPLGEQISTLTSEVAPYGFDQMEAVEIRRRTVNWNWKVSLENFSEAYHQPWVHPLTADHSFPAKHAKYADVDGPYGLFTMRQDDPEKLVPVFYPAPEGLPDPLLKRVTVFNIYPYFHILTDPSTPLWLDFNLKNESEHELVWTAFVPKGSKAKASFEQELATLKSFLEPILDEDVAICAGVARGVQSRFAVPGRLSHMEKTVHQFHNWWLDKMLPAKA